MAKKQDSYEDIMSSIFGVLFAQAKKGKPPRPPRMTGLSGQSDMARALAEVASAPAMYLKDAAFEPFKNAVDNMNVIDFHLDTQDGKNQDSSRVRMRPTNELGKYFSNPDKFVANLAKAGKTDRAIGGALLGKGLDFVTSGVWAKNAGLKAGDAWKVGLSGFDSPGLVGEREAVKMLAETSAIKALRGQGDLAGAKKVADIIRASKAPMTSSKSVENLLKKSNVSNANIGLVLGQFAGSSGGSYGKKFKASAENAATRLLGSSNKDLVNLIKGADLRDISTPENLQAFLSTQIAEQQKKKTAGEKFVKIGKGDVNKLLGDLTGDSSVRSITGEHGFRGLTGHEFRSIYTRNLQYRESIETDPKEAMNLRKARAAVYTWDRLKGGINPKTPGKTSTDFKGVLNDIERGLKNIGNSPQGRNIALKKELEKYQKEVIDVQAELVDRKNKYNNSGNFSTALGFTKAKDFKLSVKGYRAEIRAKMASLKVKGAKLDRTSVSGKRERKEIALELLMLREAEQNMLTNADSWLRRDFAIEIGRWRGAAKTFNDDILHGGLLGKFVSGYAFVVGDDYFLSPSRRTNVLMDKVLGGGGTDMLDKNDPKELSILLARNDINPKWAKLNALYYWTPGSIAKTFFYNGEGAYYGRYMRQENIIERLTKNNGVMLKELRKFNKLIDFVDGDGNLDLKKVRANWDGFSNIVSGLSGSPAVNSFVRKFKNADKMVKFFGKAGSWGSVIHRRFGFAGISGKVGKLMAAGLEKTFLKRIPGMIGAGGYIERFAGKQIGLAQLVAAAIKQGLVALAGSSGIGAPIAAVLEALPSFVYEIVAGWFVIPIAKIGSLIFWIIVLCFIALIGLVSGSMNSITTEHANVLPTAAEACLEVNPYADTYPDDYEDIISIGPAPPGSSCPIKIGMPCTQGSRSCNSGYHQANKSLDTDPGPSTVWYAPSDGEITKYTASNMCSDGKDYGGILWFQDVNGNQYRLIHVKLVGTVGSVNKDDAVAVMWNGVVKDGEGLEESRCFHNGHFHLDVMQNGAYVDAPSWYKNELGCSMYEATWLPGCNCMP